MSLLKLSRSGKLVGFASRLGLAFAVACALLVAAAFADDLSDCSQPNDLPRVLAGCTKLLQAGPAQDGYIAYRNRSSAYAALGDFEHAEQDYQNAIALNPPYLNSSAANLLHLAAPK
jgi:tetratricopeptide (TPR) repeat protein